MQQCLNNQNDYLMESDIELIHSFDPEAIIESQIFNNEDELKDYFNKELGDYIEIDGFNFQIVGIFQSEETSKYVYMSLSDARNLLDLEENEVNTLKVYSESEEYVESIASEIETFDSDYRIIASGYFSGFDDMNEQMN